MAAFRIREQISVYRRFTSPGFASTISDLGVPKWFAGGYIRRIQWHEDERRDISLNFRQPLIRHWHADASGAPIAGLSTVASDLGRARGKSPEERVKSDSYADVWMPSVVTVPPRDRLHVSE
jgi:hypothetical protein